MYELAAVEAVEACERPVEFPLQSQGSLTVIRCPTCQGLRGCLKGHERRQPRECIECREGRVVPRWTFCGFWIELFSADEIGEMARAIWGQ